MSSVPKKADKFDLSLSLSAQLISKMGDIITYPFPNFNVCTVGVWERIGNYIPCFIMDAVITHDDIKVDPY